MTDHNAHLFTYERSAMYHPSRSLKQSLLHIGLVTGLILALIPFQVAFVICFLVHGVTCLKWRDDRDEQQTTPAKIPDAYNQNVHILMLLFWLMPNMAPSLAVWVRTVATAGTISLFNDDHSPISVLPFLAIVELANARLPLAVFNQSKHR